MRAKLGSHIVLLVLASFVATTRDARADFAQCPNPLSDCTATSTGCCKQAFPPVTGHKAIIIPMDRCHQPLSGSTIGPYSEGAPMQLISAPVASGGMGLSTMSRAGNVVTVTFSANHGLSTGDVIWVSAGSNAGFDGTFAVKTGNACAPSNCNASTLQYTTSGSGTIASGSATIMAKRGGNGWCAEAPGTATRIGGNTADTGMLRAYGLIYRLMQNGIPVYWIVNPSKTAPAMTAAESASAQTFLATDVDFWVLNPDVSSPPVSTTALSTCTSGCTQPVHRLDPSDLSVKTDSYQRKEFPVRGSAFLIAPAQRQAFNAFWKRITDSPFDFSSYASQAKYNWATSGIDLYEIDQNASIVHQNFASGLGTAASPYALITGAPVAVKIDYEPPRIACLGCEAAVPQNWLGMAGLADPATPASCVSGEFVPSDSTYCVLTDEQVAAGGLVNGAFEWFWMFSYNDNTPCVTSLEKAVMDNIRNFLSVNPGVRNAGHGVFLDDSIKVAEGCPNKQLIGLSQTTSGLSLKTNASLATEPYILRYPANLFMQFGDLPVSFASGAIAGWQYADSGGTYGYSMAPTSADLAASTLRRLASVDNGTQCLQHRPDLVSGCDTYSPGATTGDVFDLGAYARFADDLSNGIVYYLPGNQLNNNNAMSELRLLLNSLIALPDESYTTTPTEIEVARSSPIVATVEGQTSIFQGTYVRKDPIPNIPKATTTAGLARFTFPYVQGHMRMIPIGSFQQCSDGSCTTSNSSRTAIKDLAGAVDAANFIPAANAAGCSTNFNGTCRSVFTTTATGRLPAHVFLNTTNAAGTLGTLMAPNLSTTERQTLVSRILAGTLSGATYVSKLGGIDRSTPAVIGTSPLVTNAMARPTMVYFGATDGMMHAVCASVGGGCDVVGRELWAFIPRTLLPELRQSTARVDGTPHVIDAYGDFDNNGSEEYRTILMFHTGMGSMKDNSTVPAVVAIDVSDPSSPKVLWEYAVTNVAARDTYEMGIGLQISAGNVVINGDLTPLVFVQSNNGGIGGPASVVTAINVIDGTEVWQRGDLYPTDVDTGGSERNELHEAAPASGIPGGAVGIDKVGAGNVTHVVYGTIYGDVWVLEADDGATQSGLATPVLRMSSDYKPIGVPPAIYAIGNTQYAAFVTGGYADSQNTLWRGENETPRTTQHAFAVSLDYTGNTIDETNTTHVPIKFDLGADEAGFAQITIVGGELFVVTDSTNVNSYDFGTSGQPTGKVYRFDFASATPSLGSTLVVAGGAGSVFNSGAQLFTASGQYGERVNADALGTTGTSIDPMTTKANMSRKLWLRTE